jgi:CDP-diacylglycerol---glycerol-3-phosphate 3-phosphatidyltransferase
MNNSIQPTTPTMNIINIPNILTLSRLIMIPVFVLAFYLPWRFAHVLAAGVFALGAITDLLDGYLARSLKQITSFGAFLDPVVDKLVVAVALLLIVGDLSSVYVTIPAAIIVGREIIVSALREWMAEIGKRTSVAVSFVGKIKTTAQMVSIVLLLFAVPQDSAGIKIIGIILLYVAALLTLWSMVMYMKAAWLDLTLNKEKG